MDGIISGIGLVESIVTIAAVLLGYVISNIGVIQSIINIAAVMVVGVAAWRNGIIFRHRSPHINITHAITHRKISNGYTHIAVTVTLHNSSRVKVDFYDGLFVAQKLAPLEDDDVEVLYNESSEEISVLGRLIDFPWEILEGFRGSWDKDDHIIVEPGETMALTVEFVVDNDIEAILITTYLYNERVVGRLSSTSDWYNPPKRNKRFLRWQEVEGPSVWIRTSAYDIT